MKDRSVIRCAGGEEDFFTEVAWSMKVNLDKICGMAEDLCL